MDGAFFQTQRLFCCVQLNTSQVGGSSEGFEEQTKADTGVHHIGLDQVGVVFLCFVVGHDEAIPRTGKDSTCSLRLPSWPSIEQGSGHPGPSQHEDSKRGSARLIVGTTSVFVCLRYCCGNFEPQQKRDDRITLVVVRESVGNS